ncbi:MAG: hypothetical protein ACK5GN_14205 [Pseudomonadota bacterium]
MLEKSNINRRRDAPLIDRKEFANELLLAGHQLVSEHVKRVVDLVAAASDKREPGIGYHGTSLAALTVAMKTGHLPPGRSLGCAGHIYFFPLSGASVNRDGLRPLADSAAVADKKAFEESAGYANDLSRSAIAARILNLDLSSMEGWEISARLEAIAAKEEPELAELLRAKGFTDKFLVALLCELDTVERGFVLELGKSALDKFEHSLGDRNMCDLKLTPPPEGLSLDDIVGIEPCSVEDLQTIEALEERYK